jgi:aldose 1-epimerase
MKIEKRPFGYTQDGSPVTELRIENSVGAAASLMNYGAAVRSLVMPDRNGVLTDVVLGYDTVGEYEKNDGYLGAVIGRTANRIGAGRFTLNGREYRLAANDRGNCLHGGIKGFDKRVWNFRADGKSVIFSRLSPDGEEGYPGNLHVSVKYTLTDDNILRIEYDAVCDADTPVNLTSHCYFNLAGGGTVLGHHLTVNAGRFLENDENCLPTGNIISVDGTPFDFRLEKPIGQDIDKPDSQLIAGGGYDHCLIIDGSPAAVLYCPDTGISMTVVTDRPGVQLYSSNGLSPRRGKGGRTVGVRDAVCLETQLFPDGMAHDSFPPPVIKAGEHMRSATEYRFGVR